MTLKGKPFLLAEDGHGEDKLAVFATEAYLASC